MSFERDGHMDVEDDSIVHIIGHFPLLLSSAISASINQGVVPALQILTRASITLVLTPIYLVLRPTVAIATLLIRTFLILFSPAIHALYILYHVTITLPFSILKRFVPFYNFFATAIIVGLLTGLILHQLSSKTNYLLGLQKSATDLRYATKLDRLKAKVVYPSSKERAADPLLLPSPRRENGISSKLLHSHLQHPSAKYRRAQGSSFLSEVDLQRWDNGW